MNEYKENANKIYGLELWSIDPIVMGEIISEIENYDHKNWIKGVFGNRRI